MLSILSSLLATALATFIPLIIGIYLPAIWKSSKQRVHASLASIASGIIFWFFIDVMNDASLLDINAGLSTDYAHIAIVLTFASSFALFFLLDKLSTRRSGPDLTERSQLSHLTISTCLIASLGIGFHAFGEGMGIGSIANSSSIIDAIGGLGPGIAYVLHKVLEGFTIGVFALLARVNKQSNYLAMIIVSGLPTIFGFLAGYFIALDSTYFFAAGASVTFYIQYKLIPNINSLDAGYRPIIFLFIGLLLMYLAGLFHSETF